MSAEDFLKLHWLVALAESGKHPLHFYGDGGDGGDGDGGDDGDGGGGDDGGDGADGGDDGAADGGEGGDEGGDEGAGEDGFEGEESDPGSDPESDFSDADFADASATGDFGAGQEGGASAGGVDEAGFADVSAADFGTAAEAGYGVSADVGAPVDALTEAQDQAAAQAGLAPESSFTDFGVTAQDVAPGAPTDAALAAALATGQVGSRDEMAAALAGQTGPSGFGAFDPNTAFDPSVQGTQVAGAFPDVTGILGYETNPAATPAGPLMEAPPSPVEQPGAKEFTEQYSNPAGLVGTTPGTVSGPVGSQANPMELGTTIEVQGQATPATAGRGGVAYDDPRGDFVGINQGPTATGYPTSVQESKGDLYGLGPSSQQSTQAQTSPTSTSELPGVTADISPNSYVEANFGNWGTPVEQQVATGPSFNEMYGARAGSIPWEGPNQTGTQVATGPSFNEVYGARAGSIPIEGPNQQGAQVAQAPPEPTIGPVGPQMGSQFPSGLVFGQPDARSYADLLGPDFGRTSQVAQKEDPWEQNQREARQAAPDPDKPTPPDTPREPNIVEQAATQLSNYLNGPQTAGMDPGAADSTSSGYLAGDPRGGQGTASPLLASAEAAAAAASPLTSPIVANRPTPTSSVNPTPYSPAPPPLGTGQYVQPGFDVAPERGYPAQRTPHNLRDAIAIALLKQTQDRLRT